MDVKVANVMVGGERLEQVKNFTYLGSTLVEDGKSEKEIRIRIGRATSALAKLDNIWRSKTVEMMNKLQLIELPWPSGYVLRLSLERSRVLILVKVIGGRQEGHPVQKCSLLQQSPN